VTYVFGSPIPATATSTSTSEHDASCAVAALQPTVNRRDSLRSHRETAFVSGFAFAFLTAASL
jgi:hypothetical protein